jgi:hypothetical protein
MQSPIDNRQRFGYNHRAGPSASLEGEPRQVRKEAAVVLNVSAGVWLAFCLDKADKMPRPDILSYFLSLRSKTDKAKMPTATATKALINQIK